MHRLYGQGAAVELVDVFVDVGRWPFTHFPRWYPTMVKLRGIPWGIGYRFSNHLKWVERASTLTWPYVGKSLCDLLRRHRADVVVSFHCVPNSSLLLAMRQLGWRMPVAVVILDMVTAHASWFAPGADLYCAPTEATRRLAIRWGVDPQRIVVTGMPIRRSFVEAMHLSRGAARRRLGLPSDGVVVLFVGGGDGMGPLARVVRAVAVRRPDAHLVAITGRNRTLYRRLRGLELPTPLRVEGFVRDMEVWMRAADILVTKAGPNTLAEAFTMGLPIVLYAALPGQETGNVTHVVSHGAGVWASRPRRAADAVLTLVRDEVARTRMAEASRALAHPHATEEITRRLWSLGDGRAAGDILPLPAVRARIQPQHIGRLS